MSSREEFRFTGLARPGVAEAAITLSHAVVKRGTNPFDVAVTAAASDVPVGRVNKRQATAGASIEDGVQPFHHGQVLKLVSDGSITAAGDLIKSTGSGKVGKATPTTADIIFGRSVEAQTTDGNYVLCEVWPPYKHY